MQLRFGAMWQEFKSSSAGFKWFCLYLLVEYVRPQSIYAPLSILPLNLLTIFACVIALFMEPKDPRPASTIGKVLGVFFTLVLLSCIFAYSPSASFKTIDIPLSWALVYYLMTRVVRRVQQWLLVLLLFLAVSFKMSQHAAKTWASRGFSFERWGITGAPGWFQDGGEFGIQMCIFLPLALAFIIVGWRLWPWWKRGILLLLPITAIAGLLASASRGGIVGGIVAIGWFAARALNIGRAMIFVAIAGAAGWALIPDEFASRFTSSGEDRTSLHRLERWTAAFDTMKHHPLLGVGYDNWAVYYPANYEIKVYGSVLIHNMFFQAAAELGATGVGLVLLLVLLSFLATRQLRKYPACFAPRDQQVLAHGLDAALLGLCVSGSFVTVLFYPYLWIHLAFVASLVLLNQQARAEAGTDKSVRRSRRPAAAGNDAAGNAAAGTAAARNT